MDKTVDTEYIFYDLVDIVLLVLSISLLGICRTEGINTDEHLCRNAFLDWTNLLLLFGLT